MSADLKRELLKIAMPWMALVVLLVIWQVACTVLDVPEIILPKPSKIFQVFWMRLDILLAFCWDTLWTTLVGFLLAMLFAKQFPLRRYLLILVLTPMMFLSGIFFPREQLPELVRTASDWLPLTNAVELVRPLFMDRWPEHPWPHALMLVITAAVAFWTALVLTRRRFRR